MTALRPPMPTAGENPREVLRATSLGLLVVLAVQFVLGMIVNLFVTIPEVHPGSKPSEYFSGSFQSVAWAITQGPLPLILHAVLGLLLVLGGLRLVVHARRLRSRRILVLAVVGDLLILGAGFNGASFLDFNEDFSSMIMATLFALALLCYIALLYLVPAGE